MPAERKSETTAGGSAAAGAAHGTSQHAADQGESAVPATSGTDGGTGGRAGLEQYDATVSPFVERFAADLTEAGMQRMASRVFACLLASEDGALNATQLAERLRISPAAVSGAVRYLSQVHMVSREREPGSRRERYRMHTDLWYETFANRDQLISRWEATLAAGAEAIGPDTAAGQRLLETQEFFDFLKSELQNLMERWRQQRAERYGE